MKKLFILLFIPVSFSFLAGNENTFSADKEILEVIRSAERVVKVKIFDYKNGDSKEEKNNTEKEINIFLSDKNHKIEQIIQTSAGAAASGYTEFHTVITIFYK